LLAAALWAFRGLGGWSFWFQLPVVVAALPSMLNVVEASLSLSHI